MKVMSVQWNPPNPDASGPRPLPASDCPFRTGSPIVFNVYGRSIVLFHESGLEKGPELPLTKRLIVADYDQELKRNIPRLDDRKIPLLSSYLSQFQYTDLIIHFERYDEEMVELDWFLNCFVPEMGEYCSQRNVQLRTMILESAPAHPEYISGMHPDVMVVRFPPNTTALIRPMD
ncbi:hypothetical protein M514_25448 [Trichuris suis]|uniref:DDE-1 domain-containing protein n=1 Tax=Trichuris suis TaxID=68888 RepID=A0A085MYM9_9BILA|nr:hypothetical protein M514_25448 [Trichuris suis]